jgi:hypothetical protein
MLILVFLWKWFKRNAGWIMPYLLIALVVFWLVRQATRILDGSTLAEERAKRKAYLDALAAAGKKPTAAELLVIWMESLNPLNLLFK